ncbi:tryptophan-rich sensory protein [Micromonospora aurantiaca (nom. illeg.)]|uniref:tryptophan-rich sensory protein n=1 Tax=Micromonospora aurantiaca (nom. illeg.) TaxID=47850 RepID=UPI00340C1E53
MCASGRARKWILHRRRGVAATFTGTSSRRYRRLNKPGWQSPSAAFPLVWTPLYGRSRSPVRGRWTAPRSPSAPISTVTRPLA